MAEWGVWSYLVVLFERRHDGSFKAPEEYKWNALASFTTHDLPTFAGWVTGHDQNVKRGLGMDPGETMDERREAFRQLSTALVARGNPELEFPNVAKFLAATNSRLVVVPMEDVLGVTDQPNLPGTMDEHPNWRQRLPATIEVLMDDARLRRIGRIMAEAGRGKK
jgi:4-alpha-glucanotransferase